MKKANKNLFTSVALLFTMAVSFMVLATPKTANAETYEPVTVITVADITSDNGASYSVNKSLDFSTKTGNFTEAYYYQFTLDSPSYILLKEYADIWEIVFGGTIKYYMSSSTTFSDNHVISTDAKGAAGSYASLYEAGTYYIKVEINYTSQIRFLKTSPYYNFSIFAQPVTKTGMTDGISQSTAIPLSNNEYCNSVISRQNTKQYFSFRQSSDGAFSTDIVASVPVGWGLPALNVALYNEAGAELTSSSTYSNNSITLSVDKLAKGNYYILVSTTDSARDKNGVCTLTVNASYQNIEKLDAPKLKSYKAGAKKITGTAVKGSKVIVKVGKKSYKATAPKGKFTIKLKSALKKGTTIKVKATKPGFRASKTVTYKI